MYQISIRNLVTALLIIFLLSSNTVYSEDLNYERVAIEAKKKLQIAKNMQFTKQQDKAFGLYILNMREIWMMCIVINLI